MNRSSGKDDLHEDANTVNYSAAAREALLVPGEGFVYTLPTQSAQTRRDRVFDLPEIKTGGFRPGDRITIKQSCQGYCDPFTVKLFGKLRVMPDSALSSGADSLMPTMAFSKFSLQAMIDILEIFQMDSQFIERITDYGVIQTMIGQACVQPFSSLMSQTAENEFALTRPLSYAIIAPGGAPLYSEGVPSLVGAVPDPEKRWLPEYRQPNSLEDAPQLQFALELKCGLTQQKCFIPLEHLTKPLQWRVTLASYQKAVLDVNSGAMVRGNDVKTAGVLSQTWNQQSNLCRPPGALNPRVETAAGNTPNVAARNISPFDPRTTGTYEVDDVRLVYDRVTLAPAANAQVQQMVNSSAGLQFHITSFLSARTPITDGTRSVTEIGESCRSLKAVFPIIFPQGALEDSYGMGVPNVPGFVSYQYKLGTTFYPDYPIETDLEARVAFYNAIGLQNSMWYQSACTAYSLLHGSNVPAFMDPYQKAPAHNDFYQNSILVENTTFGTTGGPGFQALTRSVNSGTVTDSLPVGWGFGSVTLPGNASYVVVDSGVFAGITGLGGSANTVILVSAALATGAYDPANAGSLWVSNITAGTSFRVNSTNATDTRKVYFVYFPKPTTQTSTTFNIGAAANTTYAAYARQAMPNANLFWNPLANTSAGFNILGSEPDALEGIAQDARGPGVVPATNAHYFLAPNSTSIGAGYLASEIILTPGNFTALAANAGFSAVLSVPGMPTDGVPSGAAVIVRPQVSPNFNASNGDWLSRMAVDVVDGKITLFLPNFALRDTTPDGNMPTKVAVLVSHSSLFAGGSVLAGEKEVTGSDLIRPVAGGSMVGSNANNTNNLRPSLNQLSARRGPWPLQWHSATQDLVMNGSVGAYTAVFDWNWGWFIPAYCFETDRHENTPSGLNLNIPAKRLQFILNRTNASIQPYNLDGRSGLGHWVNKGGWPKLEAIFALYHDRFFRIAYGLIDSVEW